MKKQLFDAGWEYTDEVCAFPYLPKKWQPVTLPHGASIDRPRAQQNPTGLGGGFAWSGLVTYRKRLQVPASWSAAASNWMLSPAACLAGRRSPWEPGGK